MCFDHISISSRNTQLFAKYPSPTPGRHTRLLEVGSCFHRSRIPKIILLSPAPITINVVTSAFKLDQSYNSLQSRKRNSSTKVVFLLFQWGRNFLDFQKIKNNGDKIVLKSACCNMITLKSLILNVFIKPQDNFPVCAACIRHQCWSNYSTVSHPVSVGISLYHTQTPIQQQQLLG